MTENQQQLAVSLSASRTIIQTTGLSCTRTGTETKMIFSLKTHYFNIAFYNHVIC